MMSGGYVFHPFQRPETSLSQEFSIHMGLAVVAASLGSFGDNLWGLAIATDLESESVDAYLWFESEPTLLDRDEMGEFASAFDNHSDGGVDLRLHWQVEPRIDHGPIERTLQWISLKRHPSEVLPDDFDERDLKY